MLEVEQTSLSEQPNTQSEQYTFAGDSMLVRRLAKRRADKEGSFFLPFLQAGMRLLDCGCGPGSITLGLAEAVAPGEVIGLDQDIEVSRPVFEQARAKGLQNLRFESGNVYDLPFPDDTFDAVFSNGLFSHLQNPAKAVKEMQRVLKSSGVIGLRDSDFDGMLFAPFNPVITQSWALISDLVKHNGGNFNIGKELPSLLHDAGFVRLEVSASIKSYGKNVENFWQALGHPLIKSGWLNTTQHRQISQVFLDFSKTPGAFMVLPRIEVVGWME